MKDDTLESFFQSRNTQIRTGKPMPLFFVDDLAVIAHGDDQLKRVMKIIEEWSIKKGVPINKAKSHILIVKVDQRTPNPILFECGGIELSKKVKYLGFNLCDDLSMELAKGERKTMEKQL
jgi:hypothetical protein